MKKKRIGRVAKGETYVVQMLPENMQDLFDIMTNAADDARRAEAEYEEHRDEDKARTRILTSYTALRAKLAFWEIVHAKYGHWDRNLGVRDGYALVTFEDKEKEIPDFIKRILKDIQED